MSQKFADLKSKMLLNNEIKCCFLFVYLKIRVSFVSEKKLGGTNQCCGAGAGGGEIILGPGAGAENKF